MDTLHQFMRRKHQKQEPHTHDHQTKGEHRHAAADSGSRMMGLLSILSPMAHIDERLSNYRTSRLVPASNQLIVGTILALAAGVILWNVLPVGLTGVALAVIIAATAYLMILVVGGASLMLFVRHQRSVLRQTVINSIPWRGSETVLDVGCGTGMLLNGCARKLTTGKAVGIDLWQEAVGGTPDVLMVNARAEGVADKIGYQKMDARHLSFEDGSFNVVVSSVALHHIGTSHEECEQAVAEMIRVLAPGGIISLADIAPMIEIAEPVIEQSGLRIARREQTRFFRFITAQKV